jgi:hypothetical protein
VENGTWDIPAYIEELCSFPLGRLADQTDASSGAFSRLANMGMAGTLRTFTFTSKKGRPPLRILIAPPENLPLIENPATTALLIEIRDPLQEGTAIDPEYKVLERLTITFAADVDPSQPDIQRHWDEPLAPYGKPPEAVMFSRETGKRLFSFLLRQRGAAHSFIILTGDTKAALSIGWAIMKTIHPSELWLTSDPDRHFDDKTIPADACPYLVEMAKSCRALVS